MPRRSTLHGDVRYKQLRARNNDSVKKSREKSRFEHATTMKSIKQLDKDNHQLVQNLQILKQEYTQLQTLFKQQTGIDMEKMVSPSEKETPSNTVLTINTTENKSSSNEQLDANKLDGSIILINGVQFKIVSMNKN